MNSRFMLTSVTGEYRSELIEWYDSFKEYCILLGLKSEYEIGNIIGRGTFAKVYEVRHYQSNKKFALKTIEKKVLQQTKRNFVRLR